MDPRCAVPVLSTLHSRPIDRLAVEHDDDRNYQAMRRAAIFTALPKSERSPEVVRVVRFGNLDRLPGRVGCVLDLWQYVLIIRALRPAGSLSRPKAAFVTRLQPFR